MNSQLLSQLAKARTDDMLRAAAQRRRAVPSERSVWLPTTLRRAIVRVRRATGRVGGRDRVRRPAGRSAGRLAGAPMRVAPTRPVAALFDVVAPIALYYGSRSAGMSVYFALLAGAVVPGISTTVRLIKGGTLDGLPVFVMTTMLIGVGIALIAGSPRFLLAKEAWVTAVGGAWFLVSARGRRPLAFLFARPLLEGRRAFTSESWTSLWERLPQFRRMWRISSVIWGVGLLADGGVRVVIAVQPADRCRSCGGRGALPGHVPDAAGNRPDQLSTFGSVADPACHRRPLTPKGVPHAVDAARGSPDNPPLRRPHGARRRRPARRRRQSHRARRSERLWQVNPATNPRRPRSTRHGDRPTLCHGRLPAAARRRRGSATDGTGDRARPCRPGVRQHDA